MAESFFKPVIIYMNGGEERNLTAVHGFAGRCITTLPPRRFYTIGKLKLLLPYLNNQGGKLERETRLELATPTLARLCSTTELFPQIRYFQAKK